MLSSKEVLKIHNESKGGRARILSSLALFVSCDSLRSFVWVGTDRNPMGNKRKMWNSHKWEFIIIWSANLDGLLDKNLDVAAISTQWDVKEHNCAEQRWPCDSVIVTYCHLHTSQRAQNHKIPEKLGETFRITPNLSPRATSRQFQWQWPHHFSSSQLTPLAGKKKFLILNLIIGIQAAWEPSKP